ncbi:MAG: hypothetical protein HYR91_04020 [Flavobacteriia bacterium]|nr:hypothetical protein [Flavobacteriia bacterium]
MKVTFLVTLDLIRVETVDITRFQNIVAAQVGPQTVKKRLSEKYLKAFFYGLRAFCVFYLEIKKGTSNEIPC